MFKRSTSKMSGDSASSDIVWNVDLEVNLFHAMRGHKPAGVNRHFQMISIHERVSSACKKISSGDVWRHLATMYDLQALNESEIVPFPNKNGDFDFPEFDLSELTEKSFPRTPYINTPIEIATPSKSASKSNKQDSKSSSQTPKTDVKTESRSSSSKSENRSNTASGRGESKSHSSSKSAQSSLGSNTPEPSPKRTKRTRNVPSANASPATPTEPPSKRRR